MTDNLKLEALIRKEYADMYSDVHVVKRLTDVILRRFAESVKPLTDDETIPAHKAVGMYNRFAEGSEEQ